MQGSTYKNELWNFCCEQGRIPPHPADSVRLGIFPVAPQHLQHLAWSELGELSVLQGLSCLEGPGMKGKQAPVATGLSWHKHLKAGLALKVDKRNLSCVNLDYGEVLYLDME